eukprot:474949-Pyramimonas_sp.AAC.1
MGQKQVLPHFVGHGTHRFLRAVFQGQSTNELSGIVLPIIPFLGTLFTPTGPWAPEIAARCAAVARGRAHMRRFWTQCTSWRAKKMAFQSNVIGAAVSGLTACVLSPSQEARLDSACL